MTDKGLRQTRAIVARGVEQVTVAAQQAAADPAIGASRDGVEPGKWGRFDNGGVPQPDEFPPGCPVRPLGHNDGDLFLLDAAGQVACLPVSQQIGQGTVERVFGDRIGYAYWAWPRWTKPKKGEVAVVDSFRTERARQSLWGEAYRKGVFDKLDRVRGRGVWRDDEGRLVVHCGDCLYVEGRARPAGEVGGHIYPRMAPILHPWPEPVDEGPAEILMELFGRFSWGRPMVDPLLLLGWCGVAMFSGAMRVRPSILIIGDKGRGKSTLQDILKVFFGSYILSTTDTTPAGIYQQVNQDARPVAIDELEASEDNTLPLRITKLARLAYSGGVMLRGGSSHKGVQFEARSSFLMSMINPPPVPPQELSRMGVLSLVRPPKDRDPTTPILRDDDELGSKFMRRMMDRWDAFEPLFQRYSEALRAGGHEQRGCDTYGTLLAVAHMLMGDEGLRRFRYPVDDLAPWAEWLGTVSLPEYEDAGENWHGCLGILLTRNIDMWRGGGQLTVGSVLEAFELEALDFKGANAKLAQVGLKLLHNREFPARGGKAVARGFVLAVPNSSPQVARIFEGSTWAAGPSGAGGWVHALRDAPPGVIVTGVDNRITINRHGFRCVLIDLAALDEVTGRKKLEKAKVEMGDF